ncbi:MFS transporter [Nocardiopsis sp. NRRL B-16309]|uniref:MFS transporter n=1 Tax=Nocardiopsis sp. NRRL B-16309 TaxID=1519494 RepID=UPI0006AED6BD|nr:MFS transporter [Nocardiopsis sp. NRRL B-16309]KOX24113.1 MFS transporter [Nocardiopsis sp. NRRL B-16309]
MYEETAPRTAGAGRRQWTGLAVLALPTLLLSVDVSVLYLALPHLSRDLGPSATEQLWIMDIYGFMIAGFLVTMGTLGDRIGRRRLLLTGAALFGLASVLAAYSVSAEMLIAARAALGLAGATLMPSTLALISHMFTDPRQRGIAIGVWMSCFMGGLAIGPVLGGAMLVNFWWGSVFLLGVPVMLLLLVTGPILLPESRADDAGRLDWVSVALSLATLLPVVYGLKEFAAGGTQDPVLPGAAVAVGVLFGVLFVRRQRRLANPLMDLRLFSSRAFSAALAVLLLGSAAYGAIMLFVSQYIQLVEGLSPFRAGLWLMVPALAMVLASVTAPIISQRVRPGTVIAVGLLVSTVGFLVLSQVDPTSALALTVVGFTLVSLGVGPFGALGTDMVVSSAPADKAGAAASMSETSNELGIALGVALLGSAGSAVYRYQMGDLRVADAPGQVLEPLRESLVGAVESMADLPAAVTADLLGPAHAAFADGMNTVALLSAVLFTVLALAGWAALRHVRPIGEDVPADTGTEPSPADHRASERPQLAED